MGTVRRICLVATILMGASLTTAIVLIFSAIFILNRESSKNRIYNFQEQYSHSILVYDSSSNHISRGITDLSYPIFGDDFLSFEENGKYFLISNFGMDEYMCTGSCYCGEEVEERRSISLVEKSMKYLIVAITSVVAYNIARNYFQEHCIDILSSECLSNDKIFSEVMECKNIDISNEENESFENNNHMYLCKGRCLDDINIPALSPHEKAEFYFDEDVSEQISTHLKTHETHPESHLNWIFPHDRVSWRSWLEENHRKKEYVWLIKYKVHTKKKSISWAESVEEALCFGWIDGVVKRIDDDMFMQRFTPRRKVGSNWSALNLAKARNLISQGRFSESGYEAYNLWIYNHPEDEVGECGKLELEMKISHRHDEDVRNVFIKEHLEGFCVGESRREIEKEREMKKKAKMSGDKDLIKFTWGRCGKWVKCRGFYSSNTILQNPSVTCIKL